jgi:hypothetical protein
MKIRHVWILLCILLALLLGATFGYLMSGWDGVRLALIIASSSAAVFYWIDSLSESPEAKAARRARKRER